MAPSAILYAFMALFTVTFSAAAQEYPARTVRIIVPFPPGGTGDVLPRIFTEQLHLKFGQAFVVDNRAGAAGNVGAAAAYLAQPDGYVLLASPPTVVINPILYKNVDFDATQFVPISVMAAVPNVLLAHPSLPVSNLEQLVDHAKANPGKLNYASQGTGTTSHLTAELFKFMAGGVQMTHVPYKGGAPALNDLLGGQVQVMFDNLGVSLAHIKSGKLKVLAVATEKRIPSLPDTPTVAETLPGFVSITWYALMAPPKTPLAIANRLSSAIAEIAKLPNVEQSLAKLSAQPIANTPAEAAAFMRVETERWKKVIGTANIRRD